MVLLPVASTLPTGWPFGLRARHTILNRRYDTPRAVWMARAKDGGERGILSRTLANHQQFRAFQANPVALKSLIL